MKKKIILVLSVVMLTSVCTACGAGSISKEQLHNAVDTIYDATGDIENVTDGIQDKIDEQQNLINGN